MSDVREAFEALDKLDETLTYLAGKPEHLRRAEIATIKAALQSAQGEPVGYLTNQAVARLQSDERLNGEHLYAFKPDDISKFREVYLRTCAQTAEPVAYAVFEDSGNIRIWSANNDQVDDLRARFGGRLRPLYTASTVKESLTVAHPTQPRNEDIAADLEAWLSQVRHMEGLSAHDIVESAEDYITLLRSNGGDV